MRAISAGPSTLRTADSLKWQHIGTNITFQEKIQWAILGPHNQISVKAANLNITSSHMLGFCTWLCRTFNKAQDFCNGALRASLMLTCKAYRTKSKDVRQQVIINSMLEICGTSLPETRGENLIWHMIKQAPPMKADPIVFLK